MLLIERGLDPTLEESQRILSGPLIADLIQKVISHAFQNPLVPTPRSLDSLVVSILTYRLRVRFKDIYRNSWK